MTEMQHIENQVGEIDKKVTNILVLLRGHELDKDDKGMIGVQNDHEKRLTKLERQRDQLKYTLFGMILPASYGLLEIIEKFVLMMKS